MTAAGSFDAQGQVFGQMSSVIHALGGLRDGSHERLARSPDATPDVQNDGPVLLPHAFVDHVADIRHIANLTSMLKKSLFYLQ